jgi:hypothetical protein
MPNHFLTKQPKDTLQKTTSNIRRTIFSQSNRNTLQKTTSNIRRTIFSQSNRNTHYKKREPETHTLWTLLKARECLLVKAATWVNGMAVKSKQRNMTAATHVWRSWSDGPDFALEPSCIPTGLCLWKSAKELRTCRHYIYPLFCEVAWYFQI